MSRFEDLWDEANRGAMALIGVADGRDYFALLKRMHEDFATHLSISGSSGRPSLDPCFVASIDAGRCRDTRDARAQAVNLVNRADSIGSCM